MDLSVGKPAVVLVTVGCNDCNSHTSTTAASDDMDMDCDSAGVVIVLLLVPCDVYDGFIKCRLIRVICSAGVF